MEPIDHRSPIYLQLREIVRNKIETGEYLPGMAIPSENESAETYGINRLTVRNALDALVHEGLLKRVHGKGVFVQGQRLERNLETLEGFSQTIREKNAVPSRTILTKKRRPAGEQYGALFKIESQEELYYIKRVCNVNDEPSSLEEIFIPKYVTPNLENIDLSVFPLYEVYNFYGIKPKQAIQTLDLTTLEQSDARILGVNHDQVLMLFTCISSDKSGRIIEYARTYTRADKCTFKVHFKR
jgi:GntR family transcriptional regulator